MSRLKKSNVSLHNRGSIYIYEEPRIQTPNLLFIISKAKRLNITTYILIKFLFYVEGAIKTNDVNGI